MGVVMFIMLSGKPPFGGKNNNEILNNVLHGSYNYEQESWRNISGLAKEFIDALLQRSADLRLTSEEAYNHPWIQQQRKKENENVTISGDVIQNMTSYMETVNLKRTTLTFIASRIPEDQISNLREVFSKFDTNGDGRLNLEELKAGVKKVQGIGIEEVDIENVMKVMDCNNNGFIDYTEFIAGCLQSYNYLQETHLK
jgi:calcium-dependent protein kinase